MRSVEGMAVARSADRGDDGAVNTQRDDVQLGGPPPADEAEPTEPTDATESGASQGGQLAPSTVAALPPDPEAYDSERSAHARARGLAAPYIGGGRDPEPEAGRREERFYGRLLLAMVGLIVLGGFAFGIISSLLGLSGLVGQ
jgi:hypothetical protein